MNGCTYLESPPELTAEEAVEQAAGGRSATRCSAMKSISRPRSSASSASTAPSCSASSARVVRARADELAALNID